eukprot:TRINITY_DN9634_c0_g1_i1.p1 TRINITY_DN9634_c0_g1~~TRINITY_DN9634_c0_g1_i1.p1  ORF type:complete len:203 (-),score=32.32 TRINITY_DN9634_c0_g1_i1:92-700(-)
MSNRGSFDDMDNNKGGSPAGGRRKNNTRYNPAYNNNNSGGGGNNQSQNQNQNADKAKGERRFNSREAAKFLHSGWQSVQEEMRNPSDSSKLSSFCVLDMILFRLVSFIQPNHYINKRRVSIKRAPSTSTISHQQTCFIFKKRTNGGVQKSREGVGWRCWWTTTTSQGHVRFLIRANETISTIATSQESLTRQEEAYLKGSLS